MKKTILFFFAFISIQTAFCQSVNISVVDPNNNNSSTLVDRHLLNERVNRANDLNYGKIRQYFTEYNIPFPCSKIYWRAFKWNKELELWAYSPGNQVYVLIKTFPICEIVGDLGPKRQQGDFQIPEGFYTIDLLNPNSHYHLSLHVDYPNTSDSIRGNYNSLGGDIYVHGGCETIGCIPMTNEIIEEIYLINLYTMSTGIEKIPIHIFPVRLSLNNFNKLKETYFSGNVELVKFWTELKTVYDYFEEKRMVPNIVTNNLSGKQTISETKY